MFAKVSHLEFSSIISLSADSHYPTDGHHVSHGRKRGEQKSLIEKRRSSDKTRGLSNIKGQKMRRMSIDPIVKSPLASGSPLSGSLSPPPLLLLSLGISEPHPV